MIPTGFRDRLARKLTAFNLFHAFLTLNIKPALRQAKTDAFWIRVITSEIYARTSEFSQVRSP